MKAFHVSFEGTSGSGKSTQANLLVERLRTYGIHAEYVKNPNGTPFSKSVMDAILAQHPCELAEILAFASCFCQTTNELLVPLLKRGVCVVSDRGIGSAYAHALHRCQGTISRKLFEQIVSAINRNGSHLFADITFLLSIRATRGIARKKDPSRLDNVSNGSIREAAAYAQLSREFPNWITIDANKSVARVAEEVWFHARKLAERIKQ